MNMGGRSFEKRVGQGPMVRRNYRKFRQAGRYEELYDLAPVGYFTLRDDGIIREVNRTGARMLGVTGGFLDRPIWSFVTPESQEALHLCLAQAFKAAESRSCELAMVRDSGENFYAVLEVRRALPDVAGGERLWWCVMTDVTERKKTEASLCAARNFNRGLFEAGIDSFVTLDLEGKVTDVNHATEKITGYAREELIGREWAGLFADPEKAREGYAHVLREGVLRDYPLEMRHKNGEVTSTTCNTVLYRDESGRAAGIFAVARDVTLGKRVEAERRQLAAVVEQADENVVITDRQWKIRYVNPAFEKRTGYTRREMEGKPIILLGGGARGSIFYREIRDSLERGETWTGRIAGRSKDGSAYHAHASMSPIRDEAGVIIGFAAVGRDITGQLRLEEQLRQSQKMEAIGTLASGIAHDFNNILAGILGFTEMAMDDTPQGSPLGKNLRYVLKGALRGKELVKQILTFSRKAACERRMVHLNPLVSGTVKLLRPSLGSTIEIDVEGTLSVDTVLADPSQIQQILVNLCTNSAHAMGESGGRIDIRLAELELGPDALPDPDMAPGGYLELTVKDTGTGMTKETMSRIFEPFFTTKRPGPGTGLGLAVVFGIVKSFDGMITVESEYGRGSTFSILLPKAGGEAPGVKRAEGGTLRGNERVLFVDDEDTLAEWAKAALGRFGYRVTAKTDSPTALDLFAADPYAFDLVITDQTMPGITGRVLAERLLSIRPDIPIILCSGHSEAVSPSTAGEDGIREWLMKPFSKRELAEAIRRVADGPSRGGESASSR